MRGICGLLGDEEFSDAQVSGRIAALQELVEHFGIEWELTPRLIGEREEDWESGFTLRMKGTHEHDSHSAGQTSAHRTNLMLALRIVGEWVLPPEGNCAFCSADAYADFVHGDRNNQGETKVSLRIRISHRSGFDRPVDACEVRCLIEMKDKLSEIGALRRKWKPD
jgi:hypothetical protein